MLVGRRSIPDRFEATNLKALTESTENDEVIPKLLSSLRSVTRENALKSTTGAEAREPDRHRMRIMSKTARI